MSLTEKFQLYSIPKAAEILGVEPHQIRYCQVRGYWEPRFFVGRLFVLDAKDIEDLRKVLPTVGKRRRSKAGEKWLEKRLGRPPATKKKP